LRTIGCNYKDNWEQNVHIHGAKHVRVVGCTLDGEINNGMISTWTGGGTVSEDIIIANNTIRNGSTYGIQIESGEGSVRDVHVADNTIVNCDPAGVRLKHQTASYDSPPTDITIVDNTIKRSADAILVNIGNNVRIRDNDIHDNGGDGIAVFPSVDMRDLKIRGNDIYDVGRGGGGYGVRLKKEAQTITRPIIENNDIVAQNSDSTHTNGIYAASGSGSFVGGKIVDNYLRGSPNPEIYDATGSFHTFDNDGFDDAKSSPPPSPVPGMRYLDDGSNRSDGNVGDRVYRSGAWVDL